MTKNSSCYCHYHHIYMHKGRNWHCNHDYQGRLSRVLAWLWQTRLVETFRVTLVRQFLFRVTILVMKLWNIIVRCCRQIFLIHLQNSEKVYHCLMITFHVMNHEMRPQVVQCLFMQDDFLNKAQIAVLEDTGRWLHISAKSCSAKKIASLIILFVPEGFRIVRSSQQSLRKFQKK